MSLFIQFPATDEVIWLLKDISWSTEQDFNLNVYVERNKNKKWWQFNKKKTIWVNELFMNKALNYMRAGYKLNKVQVKGNNEVGC